MKDVIENAKKRIASNGGKLEVIELGILAIEHGLSFRFLVEMLEANRVIPCGTYEAISFDLTDSEIMQAAEHRVHPTDGESTVEAASPAPSPLPSNQAEPIPPTSG